MCEFCEARDHTAEECPYVPPTTLIPDEVLAREALVYAMRWSAARAGWCPERVSRTALDVVSYAAGVRR